MKLKKSRFKFAFLCLTLFSIIFANLGFVIAAENKTHDYTQELQRHWSNLKCKIDFSSGVINSMNSLAPLEVLSQSIARMQADLAQLQVLAASNDREGFKNYIKTTYDDNLKTARSAVKTWRATNNKNLNATQKASLKTSYKDLKDAYESCHFASIRESGIGRINSFNNILEVYQKKTNKLSEKGFDVTSLNAIIQDAKTQIIGPFQQALNSANDSKGIGSLMQKYCLFDGCKNGINFHLAAKFEIAKLEIITNKIKENSNVSVEKITQLINYINIANSALNEVGTAHYTQEQKKNIWDNIKSVHELLREIKKDLGGK